MNKEMQEVRGQSERLKEELKAIRAERERDQEKYQ
jgi:hypothetical protein